MACKSFSGLPFMLTVFPRYPFLFSLNFANLLTLLAAVSTLMFALIILD